MSRPHRRIPAEFTRATEELRFDYLTETHRGTVQPEIQPRSKSNPDPLIRWVGRLWLRDASADAEPITTVRSDNHWDAADRLHGLAEADRG